MLVIAVTPKLERTGRYPELCADDLSDCRKGDPAALTRFVECYQHRIFAYLSRALGRDFPIEDLAQEVFLRAYVKLRAFDPNGTAKLSTWLLTIAHRVGVDARRRRNGRDVPLEPECHPSPDSGPEGQCRRAELRAAIAHAVAELPTEQREVFVLAEFHELSTAEIAKVVGALEGTVKTRLFRAKARLRLALGTKRSVIP